MLPVLVDDGLIEKDSDRIIVLTDEGEALAETLYDTYKVLY